MSQNIAGAQIVSRLAARYNPAETIVIANKLEQIGFPSSMAEQWLIVL